MVRKKAAVCGEERCVTTLKTAAKETTAPGERQLASNRTPFSGEKEMVTILLERRQFIRATHFTSADLFLGCSLAMVDLVDDLLPLTALLLKGQSDCEIPAAKIWPPTRTPVRDCIRP